MSLSPQKMSEIHTCRLLNLVAVSAYGSKACWVSKPSDDTRGQLENQFTCNKGQLMKQKWFYLLYTFLSFFA
jgi:hypothetical protein